MLIMKEFSYILIRVFLTLIVTPTNVFSRPKYPWSLINSVDEPVCKDLQCRIRAKEIRECLDQTVDPCRNFYKYACGGWQKQNPIPPSQVMWSQKDKFNYRMHLRMREMLEKPIMPKNSIELKRAKQYYELCSSLSSLKKSSIEVIRKMIGEAGPWPMVKMDKRTRTSPQYWTDIHFYYYKMTSDAGLFDVDISVDKNDYFKPLLELKALHSPFGLVIQDGRWKSDLLKKYHHFLVQLVKKVAPSRSYKITEKSLLHYVQDIYEFRRKLQMAADIEILDEAIYQPKTIQELQNWFDSKMVSQNNGKINWLKTLNAGFHKFVESPLSLNTRINMQHKQFFIVLANLISNTTTDTIVNHLHLYFVERYLLIDPELENMIFELIVQKGTNIGMIRSLDERWERCISESKMRKSINDMYNTKYLTEKVKRDIYGMNHDMKDMLKIHIKDSTWLDDKSKNRALARINDVKIHLGFTDKHYSIQNQYKHEKSVDLTKMDAFYSVNNNLIFISASYFQSPMYMENLPYVINYASIGFLLGHVLYHMFDDLGVTYPIYSNSTCKSLWTSDIFNVYEEKSKCIVDLYDKPVKGLKYIIDAKPNNGAKTYNENFADLMALRASYDAFKKRLLAQNRSCTILPNLKNIDCEKLFFISYATTFCANIPKWKLLRQVQYDQHSVPELRVNIPVANMPEFSKAFQCKKDSYESSMKRCYFWN